MTVIASSDVQALLSREAWSLLRSQYVGRLAFTDRALPTIRPLNYTVVGNHLLLRVGADLARRLDGQVVAFEVDDIDAEQHCGSSVVVTGTTRRLTAAAEVFRAASLPASWAGVDHQNAVYLTVGELQGRRIVPGRQHWAGQQIVRVAGRAPSVHNTQPWHFEVRETDEDVTLDLYAVPARRLPVLDPDGRQLLLSCGAALDHAVLAAEALGMDVRCELQPVTAYPALARLTGRKGGVPPAEAALLEAVGRRHTPRGRFTADAVPERALDAARAVVSDAGCWLQVLAPEDVPALRVLLSRADAQQRRQPGYLEELGIWSEAPAASGFGIPDLSRDPTHGAGSSLALRDFGGAPTGVVEDPPPADHPVVVVLGSDGDGPVDWLACGRALSRLLLTVTSVGLAAQPLGQVTDGAGWRSAVRTQLGLPGYVQLVLRIGYPAHEVPDTPRLRD